MKTDKLLFVLLFLSCTSFVSAQEYTFKVLANKGSNEIKSGESWQPVKAGAVLKSGDELKVGENSYIGLVHVSGKPMELKQSGNYKIADLASKVGTGSSVLSKYADFILSSNSAEGKKNKLSATGAVHRGEASAIQLMLPESQHAGIYSNSAIVSWEGTSVPGPYIVTIKNMFEDELAKLETPEHQLTLDLTKEEFVKENAFLVEVKSKAEPTQVSKQHLIKRLAPAEQQNVEKSLDEIEKDVDAQSALFKYLMAGFYEEHKLYIDAVTAYLEAIKLEPEVLTYTDAYEEFLLRQGIKRQ